MPLKSPTRLALAIIALATCGSTAFAENITPDLQINGFATAGMTSVTDDFGGRYLGSGLDASLGFDNDGSFRFDNVLGLQLTYQLDDRVDLVGQLVSVGEEDYDTRAEWAYLAYRVNDNLRLRAGRFALPLYMYSENIRVGQAYPWARLPVEVYSGIPFSNSDGLDLLYRLSLGNWDLNAQAYHGEGFGDKDLYTVDVKNLHGLNVTLGNGSFAVRAGYNTARTSVNFLPGVTLPSFTGAKNTFADFGLSYDDGKWFAAAEAIQFRLDSYINDTDAAFVSVGHYFGKWLPYVMFSKLNTVNGDECTRDFVPYYTPAYAATGPFAPAYAAAECRAFNKEQTSYSVGFRYDASKRVSVKLEVDHITDFHDSTGLFALPRSGAPLAPVPGLPATPGTLTDSDSAEVITFNINAAF